MSSLNTTRILRPIINEIYKVSKIPDVGITELEFRCVSSLFLSHCGQVFKSQLQQMGENAVPTKETTT